MDIIQNTGNVIIYYVIPTIIVLGIMIFFHELGHFLAAKFFNVKVLKFALGFGPRIVARVVGETEYSIRYLPLGGFVKMLGEDDFGEDDEPIDEKDAKRAFNHQHRLKRIAIVAAGPIFNLILAFFLYFGLFAFYGYNAPTSEIGEIADGFPAQEAGLKAGDIIISIGEKDVKTWGDVVQSIEDKAGAPLNISVRRGGELLTFSLVPQETTGKNIFGEEIKYSAIGIGKSEKIMHVNLNPFTAFKEAGMETWFWIDKTYLVVKKLIQGVIPIDSVGGPIKIGQMTGEIVRKNIGKLIPFMAIISINLGLLNLLPIPILDGGVILFLLIELVTRKPISIDKREFAQKIGFALLILLMIVVFYNDITKPLIPK